MQVSGHFLLVAPAAWAGTAAIPLAEHGVGHLCYHFGAPKPTAVILGMAWAWAGLP